MYGIVIQAIIEYLRTTLGDTKWDEIRQRAGIRYHTFTTHKTYSETVVPRICQSTMDMTGVSRDELMESFGSYFVGFVGGFSYDRMLRVLGRNVRDFLNGLDNLHEYLRFSYPKLKPPSFIVENESRHGITLRYRSRRKGFVTYVRGQIKQVGVNIYNETIKVEVLKEEISKERIDVIMKLIFNNTGFIGDVATEKNVETVLPIKSSMFFDMFPFHIVFDNMMVVRHAGQGLLSVLGDVQGQSIDEVFTIIRPMVDFSWEQILGHTNNVFELATIYPVGTDGEGLDGEDGGPGWSRVYTAFCAGKPSKMEDKGMRDQDVESLHSYRSSRTSRTARSDVTQDDTLHLKGQMMHMSDWRSIIFIGTPVLTDLDTMMAVGLYINDLSMHDSSRDLVLAGTQQSAELKIALEQEQQKSKKLEDSMKKLDSEMQRTDELLYQMIPKQVADRLRSGEPAVATCEVFANVTILFSDVVGFTTICSKITPMEVVSMLNAMYTKFDQLIELHRVYKVETIGDAYMVVGGAPNVTKYHATLICDMALDMCDVITELKDPSTGESLKCRVGIHSGACVAGVVGVKMPRYCLFGDTVNTASRMESNGLGMKIHISETTKVNLQGVQKYKIMQRDKIEVKGKGEMNTYWLSRAEGSQSFLQTNEYVAMLEKQETHTGGDSHSVYSPVTTEDVRRSLGNLQNGAADDTAATTAATTLHKRSTSRGSAYTPVGPADALSQQQQQQQQQAFSFTPIQPFAKEASAYPSPVPPPYSPFGGGGGGGSSDSPFGGRSSRVSEQTKLSTQHSGTPSFGQNMQQQPPPQVAYSNAFAKNTNAAPSAAEVKKAVEKERPPAAANANFTYINNVVKAESAGGASNAAKPTGGAAYNNGSFVKDPVMNGSETKLPVGDVAAPGDGVAAKTHSKKQKSKTCAIL